MMKSLRIIRLILAWVLFYWFYWLAALFVVLIAFLNNDDDLVGWWDAIKQEHRRVFLTL